MIWTCFQLGSQAPSHESFMDLSSSLLFFLISHRPWMIYSCHSYSYFCLFILLTIGYDYDTCGYYCASCLYCYCHGLLSVIIPHSMHSQGLHTHTHTHNNTYKWRLTRILQPHSLKSERTNLMGKYFSSEPVDQLFMPCALHCQLSGVLRNTVPSCTVK